MRDNNTIQIKNQLPELLEAVCTHSDCPEWLSEGIYDLISERPTMVTFSANFFRAQLSVVGEPADVLDMEVLNEQ